MANVCYQTDGFIETLRFDLKSKAKVLPRDIQQNDPERLMINR